MEINVISKVKNSLERTLMSMVYNDLLCEVEDSIEGTRVGLQIDHCVRSISDVRFRMFDEVWIYA